MNTPKNLNPPHPDRRKFDPAILSMRGSVLVYLIVVILIFGVLGVTMVSLFTSATISSATPNDARRAYYIAESGVRYALSRIRNVNFHQDLIEDINQTTAYTLNDGSSFSINVFSPWFISPSSQNRAAPDSDNPFTLTVPNEGKIPLNFSIPSGPEFRLVNLQTFKFNESLGIYPPQTYAAITGSSVSVGDNSLTISLDGSHSLQIDADDIACIAVQPTDANTTLQAGDDIYIAADAKNFFPPRNGTIRIVSNDGEKVGEYVYEELVDESTKVKLTELAKLPGTTNFIEISSFDTDDWVVLSQYNYRVIASGTSGDVTVDLGLDKQVWVFPPVRNWTITQRDFIEDVSPKVSDTSNPVAKTELGPTVDEDKIILGGNDPGFGDLWYGGDKPIGGNSNFCQNGQCFFQDGIRVFFTLGISGDGVSTSQDGEGFTFALIAGGDDGTGNPVNTKDSAGGDIQLPELLAYGGSSWAGGVTGQLDGSGKGLRPPKMALEFDTRTNLDEPLDYCSSQTDLTANTRNDPQSGGLNKDVLQYVFWGSDDENDLASLNCRDPGEETYDDNRHDAERVVLNWTALDPHRVVSWPAVGSDGTIYVGADDGYIYAINPDGTRLWRYTTDTSDQIRSSPTISSDGIVYIGTDDDEALYAFDPATINPASPAPKWKRTGLAEDVHSKPALSPDEKTVYVASKEGTVYAIAADSDPPGQILWSRELRIPGDPIRPKEATFSSPAVSKDGKTVYIGREEDDGEVPDEPGAVFAIHTALSAETPGTIKWVFPANGHVRAIPLVGPDETIYVGSHDNKFYAINPDGSEKWRFDPRGGDVNSSAAFGAGNTIIVGSNDNYVYVGHDAGSQFTLDWEYFTGRGVESSPLVGPDGTIYIGNNGGELFAFYQDPVDPANITLRWQTQLMVGATPAVVKSRPAIVEADGTLYVSTAPGDTDEPGNLNSINQYAQPRNFRDNSAYEKKMISSADFPTTTTNNWLQEGPWAVRMEVTRDTVAGDEGVYVLKTWVEKCTDAGCSNFLSSSFRDTTINYKVASVPPKLEQAIKLSNTDHDKFDRFLFGFTTAAASGDTQESIIKFFELTFIRPGIDGDVTTE